MPAESSDVDVALSVLYALLIRAVGEDHPLTVTVYTSSTDTFLLSVAVTMKLRLYPLDDAASVAIVKFTALPVVVEDAGVTVFLLSAVTFVVTLEAPYEFVVVTGSVADDRPAYNVPVTLPRLTEGLK